MTKPGSRLSPPTVPESVVERLEVNRAIDTAMKKTLVFIHAPAGFGKTIAMSMWLSARRLPSAWIPLTVYDDDLSVFCRYLLLALSELGSVTANGVDAALSDPGFAVFSALPHGYTRIFANEGAAVIPVLQKLYNRLSVNPKESDAVVFVRTVLLLANEMAQSHPGLTSGIEEIPTRLSKQQLRSLKYLALGKNNRQICQETSLKLNTVKAHLFKLYEKLDVHSSTEVVLKAYRLGIIEKKMNRAVKTLAA